MHTNFILPVYLSPSNNSVLLSRKFSNPFFRLSEVAYKGIQTYAFPQTITGYLFHEIHELWTCINKISQQTVSKAPISTSTNTGCMNERKDLLDHTCVWPRRACLFVPPYNYDERNRNAYDRKIIHFEETAAYQVKLNVYCLLRQFRSLFCSTLISTFIYKLIIKYFPHLYGMRSGSHCKHSSFQFPRKTGWRNSKPKIRNWIGLAHIFPEWTGLTSVVNDILCFRANF